MTGQRTRVPQHPFTPDPDVPADHRGRGTCATCRLIGEPGDGHHPLAAPLPPARPLTPERAAEVRAREAAILGERDDE